MKCTRLLGFATNFLYVYYSILINIIEDDCQGEDQSINDPNFFLLEEKLVYGLMQIGLTV